MQSFLEKFFFPWGQIETELSWTTFLKRGYLRETSDVRSPLRVFFSLFFYKKSASYNGIPNKRIASQFEQTKVQQLGSSAQTLR